MNEMEHDMAIRIWSGGYAVDKVITNEGKAFRLKTFLFI